MKNLKQRLIATILVVALAMTLSSFAAVGVSAADTTSPLSAGAEGLLRYLDIITESKPDYNKALTRGELAHMAARVANAVEYAEESSRFADVPVEHPYYQDINALAAMDIVHGVGNGMYRPDDSATELEVCKVFCVILGYDPLGYFETYFKVANRAGVTDGINIDGVMTYGEAVRVAYNTLHTEICEAVTFGDNVEYRIQDGFYALERYHGLVQQQGLVEGIGGSTLTHADSSIPDGKLLIDGRYFNYDDESLLGKYVIFYGEKDKVQGGTKADIAYIYAPEEKNQILTLAGEDVIGLTGGVLKYWVGSKEKQVQTIGVPDVVYNGVAYPKYTQSDLKPGNGTVTLIDNNKDNYYDVIVVDAYTYAVCSGADDANDLIYSKYPKETIGSKTQDVNLVVYHEKGRVKPSFLKPNEVLAIRSSKNTTGTKKITVEVIGTVVSGAVTAIKDDKFTVAGQEFTIIGETVSDKTEKVKIGEVVSVYIHQGVCAAILHNGSEGYQFGYLVNARNSGTGFSGKLSVQIVDNNRVLHEYEGVDKIKVDEIVYTKIESSNGSEGVLDRLLRAAAETYQNASTKWKYSQPVRYQVNGSGQLTHIDTLLYDETLESKESLRLDARVSDFPDDEKAGGSLYCSNAHTFESIYTNEMVFGLPATESIMMVANNARDKTEYYTTGFTNEQRYLAEGYTIDPDTKIAKYLVVYNNVQFDAVEDLSRYCIVADINTVLDADGYPVRQVTLHESVTGTIKRNLIDAAANVELEVGDIIRYTGAGEDITMIERSFPIATHADNARVQSSTSGHYKFAMYRRISYGTVYATDGISIMTHTTSVPEDIGGVEKRVDLHNYKPTTATKYYTYEVVNGQAKVKEASFADVVPYRVEPDSGQRVIMFTESAYLRIVYIIK